MPLPNMALWMVPSAHAFSQALIHDFLLFRPTSADLTVTTAPGPLPTSRLATGRIYRTPVSHHEWPPMRPPVPRPCETTTRFLLYEAVVTPLQESLALPGAASQVMWLAVTPHLTLGIPPPKAVCRDLLIGFKSMPYVMRYDHFAH